MPHLDIHSATDRAMKVPGLGYMLGFPTRPGESSAATTGVPTNGVVGYSKGATFHNWKGGVGSALYVNDGDQTSSLWVNVA